MIISHRHKFIFVKTRKTAGSSIEKYLIDYLGENDICTGSKMDNTPKMNTSERSGHLGWEHISRNFKNEWKNYFKFAVERNPWDKMVSAYYFFKKTNPKKVEKGFENFIMHCDKENDWNKYARGSEIMVDKLINYDKLHESFLDLPIPYNGELLKVYMKSDTRTQKDYRSMYSDSTKKIIEEKFKNSIEYFNYTF